ncbi:protein of unknown function [Bradyrhizobium vignae]|uniref:Uncharacterized protein n=1 Tax=Bradyrhizobium vignae TaxID=1549949 RepID=A0A2U3PVT3_9BRAD|nr:protein of unknown function [Bradyrhizobium vignae]
MTHPARRRLRRDAQCRLGEAHKVAHVSFRRPNGNPTISQSIAARDPTPTRRRASSCSRLTRFYPH